MDLSSTATVSTKTVVSGAATLTIVGSGFSTIYNVLVYPMSGGPGASSSGPQIQIFDSVSGASASCAGLLVWSYGFGAQSGFGSSAANNPSAGARLEIPMTSGIVAVGAAGWFTELIYTH